MEQKIQVTQDALYEYLLAHDIKLSRLAELIGVVPEVVISCFKHHCDWHGHPRKFNSGHIKAINVALPTLADELRRCLLQFGSDRTFTNRFGSTYDPALVEPLKVLGKYINLSGMLARVLGWSASKNNAVMSRQTGRMYGCISQKDATMINTEILSIAGVLANYEVIVSQNSINQNN